MVGLDIFRAMIEGIAFGSEAIFKAMRENGYRPNEFRIVAALHVQIFGCEFDADVSEYH